MALTQVTDLNPGDTLEYQGESRRVSAVTPYGKREVKVETEDGRSIILSTDNWFQVA